MDAESLGKSVLCGGANPLPELTGPTPRNLRECVEAALEFAEKEKPKGCAACRKAIAKQALEFGRRAGISSQAASEAAKTLAGDERALVVEVAHQPTLFPYVGFYQKIVLGKAVAEELKKKTKAPVVVVFGFLDSDFVQGKWFRKTFLPFSRGKDGILELEAPVSKKNRKKAACAVPAPSAETVGRWKQALATWLSSNESDLNKKEKKEGKEIAVSREQNAALKKNLSDACALIDECAKTASSLAEFNEFFVAKTAVRMGCGDFLFYEYSATQGAFGEDYEFLVERQADYARSSKKYFARAASAGIDLGFNEADEARALAPFWFDCECGAKNAVVIENGGAKRAKQANLAEGKCVECGKIPKTLDWKRVSPRAISRPIVVSRGLAPSIFVSGIGAFGFHLVARGVANDLGVSLCPFATWIPEIDERGIAQRVSESVVAPSVLDAWINFGLEATAQQMRAHLTEKKNGLCEKLVLE